MSDKGQVNGTGNLAPKSCLGGSQRVRLHCSPSLLETIPLEYILPTRFHLHVPNLQISQQSPSRECGATPLSSHSSTLGTEILRGVVEPGPDTASLSGLVHVSQSRWGGHAQNLAFPGVRGWPIRDTLIPLSVLPYSLRKKRTIALSFLKGVLEVNLMVRRH